MRHIGHPIVGDRLYGQLQDDAPRLMLHASELRFEHPLDSGETIHIESTPPF